MKNKKILIVEDEQIIAENLRLILNEYGYNFIDVAVDDSEAKQLFQNTLYDLVLMDINLGENKTIDGIDLIKQLKTKYSFLFMYVTANADRMTVEKAKNTNPTGYIVKPFNNASIYANVEIALNSIKKEVFFTHIQKGMQQKIALSKITYIHADGAYINVFTLDERKYFIRKSLIDFNQTYPNDFIRIHKSILVNKKHIQAYTSQKVRVNNCFLPIGRTYKINFINKIKGLSF